VSSSLSLSPTGDRSFYNSPLTTLINKIRWNRDLLLQAFTDNPEKICLEAGVASLQVEKPSSSPKNQINCLVCLETVEEKDSFALGCGHRYCLPCWRTYLELKITAGPECIFSKCMNPTCAEIVNESAVKKLVSDGKYAQFKRFMIRSFVADNPLVCISSPFLSKPEIATHLTLFSLFLFNAQVKWCPAPNCTYSVRCERKARPVTCKCGFAFCFNCCDFKIGDHTPATCSQVCIQHHCWLLFAVKSYFGLPRLRGGFTRRRMNQKM